MKTAIAIRHLAFEDAGLLAPALGEAGYELRYLEAWRDDLSPAADADLLVVLGGPIGVYDVPLFPFLADEIRVVEQRLAADRPTIGFCLGAQIMAKALGAAVYPGGTQEIGWAPLTKAEGLLAPLEGRPVLHWHGDTFDLPDGSTLLASSAVYPHQAFSHGRSLALQFHMEVTAADLEAWLVGHSGQLASLGISPNTLREDAAQFAPACEAAARRILEDWLGKL